MSVLALPDSPPLTPHIGCCTDTGTTTPLLPGWPCAIALASPVTMFIARPLLRGRLRQGLRQAEEKAQEEQSQLMNVQVNSNTAIVSWGEEEVAEVRILQPSTV